MNINQTKARVEAEYKAHRLYIELYESVNGDPGLMVLGLSIARNIIEQNINNLLPPPTIPPAPAPEPKAVKADTPPLSVLPTAPATAPDVGNDDIAGEE